MRFSICNETFQGWDWERTCRFVQETGYEGIEIAPFTFEEDVHNLAPKRRQEIRRIADSFGLPITGLHWLLVSPKGLSVTSDDAALRQKTSHYLCELARLCADLGGSIMVFGSPAQRRLPPDGSPETAARRYCETLLPALDIAAQHGITICVEPLPPPEADFILTLAEATKIISRLDHPAARTIFDVKSACSEDRALTELIREFAPHIAHVHANDANRRGPGFGDTDFGPVLGALKEIGYNGWVSVEVFDYSPNPETIARESLKTLRAAALQT